MEETSLTNSVEKEIFNKSLDLSTDYAEFALDTIISDDVLKEIPFVKTLVSFYNISSSIVARHNVKKIIVFFQEFHSQKMDYTKLEKFKLKLDTNSQYKNEVLETILVLLEKFIDNQKSKILANLLISHIQEKLTWEEFQKLSFILNSLNPTAYTFLENCVIKKSMKMYEHIEGQALLFACGIGTQFEDRFRLTKNGENLYEFGFKPLKK